MEKTIIRKKIRTILQKLNPEDIRRKSTIISEKLFQTAWWNEAKIILAFCSMEYEMETSEIIYAAFDTGKTVGVPRVAGNSLVFHDIRSLENEADFTMSHFCIKEPVANLPVLTTARLVSQQCLIVTPGLAFDRKKNRLGRGKGFYDRFLWQVKTSQRASIFTVGVCFAEQLLEYVPMDDRDHIVDGVITEQEVIY